MFLNSYGGTFRHFLRFFLLQLMIGLTEARPGIAQLRQGDCRCLHNDHSQAFQAVHICADLLQDLRRSVRLVAAPEARGASLATGDMLLSRVPGTS